MKTKLIFFGNERLATAVDTSAPTLRELVAAGYEIKAVVANYTEAISRQHKALEIVEVAHAYHIPVLMPDKLVKIADKLRSYEAQAAVLVAYGQIIPQQIIDIFPGGIINIHPSLLPKLRGSTPVETAILDGLAETGVSLMQLTAHMDAGPVYAQTEVKLRGGETKQQLADKLLSEGSKLLIANLEAILNGSIGSKPQVESEATYTKLIKKEDGVMDFGQPAEVLERQVRCYAGWPKSTAEIHGQKIIVTRARVAKNEADGDLILPAKNSFLEIPELVAPSGKTVSGKNFLLGYKKEA